MHTIKKLALEFPHLFIHILVYIFVIRGGDHINSYLLILLLTDQTGS